MTIKTSISLPDAQAEFAKDLVEQGLFSSLSAVAQHGIELVRQRQEAERVDTEALRAVLQERAKGPFVDAKTFRSRMAKRLEDKRRAYGLDH
ncbi:hypothetical protein MED193_00920 [Roseobacter sp. MED193]|uniref:ribbon-helix-helix domain-containing protein n=1 Tax=Roseobacter sp. MED193 TaxID=314262 RepID=UPI000068A27F|nr:hypothetical protein [Roseobacter sp. MED193]EAQ45272.1 hypothetical protein MED193_00920 [Roseobacter sp. MED193]